MDRCLAEKGIISALTQQLSVVCLLPLSSSSHAGCMVYEKLGEQIFGTPGKMIVFGATSLQNVGGKGNKEY